MRHADGAGQGRPLTRAGRSPRSGLSGRGKTVPAPSISGPGQQAWWRCCLARAGEGRGCRRASPPHSVLTLPGGRCGRGGQRGLCRATLDAGVSPTTVQDCDRQTHRRRRLRSAEPRVELCAPGGRLAWPCQGSSCSASTASGVVALGVSLFGTRHPGSSPSTDIADVRRRERLM